jgi:choline dehydrogenase-like flavoprotein
MVFMRGNKLDYDRLGDFFPPDSASKTKDQNWSWENLLPFFKKSEHYTPPDADEEEVKKWGAGVGWNGKFHGDSGGVQYGFPRFVWPSTG